MKFTDIEIEIIYLKAVVELIDSAVNYEVISIYKSEDGAQAIFRTMTHQKYFNIILVDFLSKSDKKITGDTKSYLKALSDISENPKFDVNNSISYLKDSVKNFIKWLEDIIEVEVWFPSIELKEMLKIKRVEFIKICGNISKHNFTRLSNVTNDIKAILQRNNINRSDEDTLSLLADFNERFHTDIFNYHGSFLVEQLNDIRWGIHKYLEPTYKNSINYIDNNMIRYEFRIPKGIGNDFSKNCFVELLNDIRKEPNVKVFRTNNSLRTSY